jgi:hypothetical protein
MKMASGNVTQTGLDEKCIFKLPVVGSKLDFLKVRFGIRTFPACFARFLPTYIVVGGWPWCDWGCVIILANEKRIFK